MVEVFLFLLPPLLSVFIVVHHTIFDKKVGVFRLLLYVFFLFILFTVLNNLISLMIFKLFFKPAHTFVQTHLAEPLMSFEYLLLTVLFAVINGLAGRILQLYGTIELSKTPRTDNPSQKGIK